MTRQETKLERWFREGAAAHVRVMSQRREHRPLVEYVGKYPCPLCLDLFDIRAIANGTLTIEHVPPRNVGGVELLLTCKQCNSKSGTAFDAEPGKIDRLRSLAQGTHDKAVTATFSVNGVGVDGNLSISDTSQPNQEAELSLEPHSGGGIYFNPVTRINNPASLAQFNETLDGLGATRFSISFSPRIRFDVARAKISWIRSAYLAAFAVFGWRYVLQEVFTPLRAQLQAGREAVLPDLHCEVEGADPERREILVCETPGRTRCVIAIMGLHVVILPPYLAGELTLDDLATTVRQGSGEFEGVSVPWPKFARYELDNV